jgi:hypothetical protein
MGGVAGHMAHIHESMDLTFGDIKDLLRGVATAELDVLEKVDGQNLFFTWNAKLGQLRTARNAGDVAKGGMSPEEFASKWKGHPAEDAFTQGFEAIEQAVGSLSDEQRQAIFGPDGKRYVNAEVMYSGNPNMIQYDGNYVVVHNLQEFPGGTVVNSGEFQQLVDAIEGFDAQASKGRWQVAGPQLVPLQDISEGEHLERLESALDSISGGRDGMTLGDLVAERLRMGPVGELRMPEERKERLIRRIVGLMRGEDVKSLPDIKELKKGLDPDTQKSISDLATTNTARKAAGEMTADVAQAISDFAVEVLRGMKSFFVSDHDAEVQRMRAVLEDAISKIESYQGADAEKMGELLQKQMEKLGGVENVAQSIEGIVFEYPPGSGQLYKLTGSFAMVNQIVGRAMRLKEAEQSMQGTNEAYGRALLRFLLG